MTGKGALRLGRSDTRIPSQGGIGAPCIGMYDFFSRYWNMGRDAWQWLKKPRTSKKGQDLLLGANSPFKNVPLLNMKQTVNIVPLLYILQIGY